MADSVVTVRDVFDLPHADLLEESSPRWQTLRQWINEELQGVKKSAFDDVSAKIEELLEIPITGIFVASWIRTDAIKDLLEESRKAPDSVTSVELGDHSIKSQHHPHVEVRNRNGLSRKVGFTLRLLFKLKGFSLRIQNGSITAMQSGPCEMQGALEYQGLAVAERKNAAIELPASLTLDGPGSVEIKESLPEKASDNGSGEKTAQKTAIPLEPPRREAPVKPPREAHAEEPPIPDVSEDVKLTPAQAMTAPVFETASEAGLNADVSKVSPAVATASQPNGTGSPADPPTIEAEEEREVFVL